MAASLLNRPAYRPLSAITQVNARFLTTQSSSTSENSSGKDGKVSRLITTPSGSQQEATPDQLREMLKESERRRNLLLIWAIAAFLAADITLALLWYFYADDDPSSPNYVPDDWKDLVRANLGISKAPTVPPLYVGAWESDDNESLTVLGKGQFLRTERYPNSEDIKSQSSGTIFAADSNYITVKVSSMERFKVDKAPELTSEGWVMVMNGKRFKRQYQTPKL